MSSIPKSESTPKTTSQIIDEIAYAEARRADKKIAGHQRAIDNATNKAQVAFHTEAATKALFGRQTMLKIANMYHDSIHALAKKCKPQGTE